jgi:hypothetical protein
VIKEWFNIWLFLLCAVILLTFVVISMPFVAVHNVIQRFRDRRLYARRKRTVKALYVHSGVVIRPESDNSLEELKGEAQ